MPVNLVGRAIKIFIPIVARLMRRCRYTTIVFSLQQDCCSITCFVFVIAILSCPAILAKAASSNPAMKRLVVAPNSLDTYSCPPDRQLYFVQATIERQTIPVIMMDAMGKEIAEGEFIAAHSFKLDRAHLYPVSVVFACGP